MSINKLVSVKIFLVAGGCLTAITPLVISSLASASAASPHPETILPVAAQITKPVLVPTPARDVSSKLKPKPKPGEVPETLAQNTAASPSPTVAMDVSPTPIPDAQLQALPQNPDASPAPKPADEVSPTPTPIKRSPTGEPGDPALNTSNSFWLDNYPLNDLYQYLARQADYQFFQNPFIDSIKVTGELFKGNDPLENMRELALQYNLVLFRRGRTLYALTQDQIATLPQQEYRYELKYLHPRPEDIQRMLGHFLTPDHGSATLEPQINTIVVSDNETVIPKIARYLKSIDVPRRQISIQVRVISITTTGDKNTGVDWSSTLGKNGLTLSATAQSNLDAAFGFTPLRQLTKAVLAPTVSTTTPPIVLPATIPAETAAAVGLSNGGTNVILGPVTVSAVLHALYENTRAHTENAPMVITEDNQQSQVRVVTRTPIVVSTVTVSNGVSNISNDVRYYLDPSDAAKNREIGTTLYVTPSILPDNTIRLQIDGTVAAQVGTTLVPTGSTIIPSNSYPIVNEAHLVNLSRVPSGYSLILGGFVTVSNTVSNNKVPILGSIPLLGQAFRFKSTSRSRTNLAFIITPVAFQAENPQRSVEVSEYDRGQIIGPRQDLSDPDLLGRVNENATDFHNALSTGQIQESDKNPVNRHKLSKPKKQNPAHSAVPEAQAPKPDDE
jgi:Bacterial type II and III secretion system protein